MYAKLIKKIRSILGVSVAKMASAIDMPARTITSYERGERTPSIDFLAKLCINYGLDINSLISQQDINFIEKCCNTHELRKSDTPFLNYQNWGNRLAKILSENKETTYSFSKRTGIPEHRIERFILDSIEPTIRELNSIKSNVDISIDELLYGEIVEKSTQEDDVCLSANEILKLKELLKNS